MAAHYQSKVFAEITTAKDFTRTLTCAWKLFSYLSSFKCCGGGGGGEQGLVVRIVRCAVIS